MILTHIFFSVWCRVLFFRCSVECARGFAFPKNNPFSPVEYMHYSENYSIFFSPNRIPSEPSSPMLRLLAQTFERMISQKKRNRGIKRRRLLQNVTPLLTSSETHSSWSKQTNKRKKNKDCRKTRKCSEITAPYQCYIKSLVPYRFKLRLEPKNAMNLFEMQSKINV